MFVPPPSLTKSLVALVLGATHIVAPPFAYPREIGQGLPQLVVEARGELVLDGRGDVHYKLWKLQPLHASAHIGMLMVLPARISTRKEIAPLEEAMDARGYDYRRLSSTSIVNLADATWGATLMVESELRSEKRKEPDVHLVVDEQGEVRRALELQEGVIHVLLYNCRGEILHHHQGRFTVGQAQQILATLDTALRNPSCGVTRSVRAAY